ncbi:MAG: hypothetical protein M3Q00_01320 [Pseudomonadota bacterium]|nr:hypothetical protein [Pseudomonadota bacterium]
MGKNWKSGDTTGVNPQVLAEIRAQQVRDNPAKHVGSSLDVETLSTTGAVRETEPPRPPLFVEVINELAQGIHANARAHGWWEDSRSNRATRALITSEHAEALEAFRDGEPNVWFSLGGGRVAVRDAATAFDLACAEEKPLGVGIELVDGLIRALDWISGNGFRFSDAEIEIMKQPRDVPPDVVTFPEQIDWLTQVLYSEGIWRGYVMAVLAVAKANDIDVWECIRIKHAYNVTRPYKHGGKKA